MRELSELIQAVQVELDNKQNALQQMNDEKQSTDEMNTLSEEIALLQSNVDDLGVQLASAKEICVDSEPQVIEEIVDDTEPFDPKALSTDFPTGLVDKNTWIVDEKAIPRRVDKGMEKMLKLGFGHVGKSQICLFHRPA